MHCQEALLCLWQLYKNLARVQLYGVSTVCQGSASMCGTRAPVSGLGRGAATPVVRLPCECRLSGAGKSAELRGCASSARTRPTLESHVPEGVIQGSIMGIKQPEQGPTGPRCICGPASAGQGMETGLGSAPDNCQFFAVDSTEAREQHRKLTLSSAASRWSASEMKSPPCIALVTTSIANSLRPPYAYVCSSASWPAALVR